MGRIGKEGGWSVLAGDRRSAKQKRSRGLFVRAGLIGFFPLPAVMQLKLHGRTARILLAWPAITIMSETIAQGCFELPVKGKLRQMACTVAFMLPEELARKAVMPLGSAAIFIGSTLHAGGANISERARRGVLTSSCQAWI